MAAQCFGWNTQQTDGHDIPPCEASPAVGTAPADKPHALPEPGKQTAVVQSLVVLGYPCVIARSIIYILKTEGGRGLTDPNIPGRKLRVSKTWGIKEPWSAGSWHGLLLGKISTSVSSYWGWQISRALTRSVRTPGVTKVWVKSFITNTHHRGGQAWCKQPHGVQCPGNSSPVRLSLARANPVAEVAVRNTFLQCMPSEWLKTWGNPCGPASTRMLAGGIMDRYTSSEWNHDHLIIKNITIKS
jgi:hypothetical protein